MNPSIDSSSVGSMNNNSTAEDISTLEDDGENRPTLKKGLDQVQSLRQFGNQTSMCWAAAEGNVAIMQGLRDHGADVNASDYDRRTPLHIAVSDDQVEAARFLLQCGARIDAVDRWGRSPIDIAIEAKNHRMLQLLEHDVSGEARRLIHKALKGQQDLPSIRRSTSTDALSLFQAVEGGDTEKVKRAWLSGLPMDLVDEYGRTSLHLAVENGQVGMVELLLSADVNTEALDTRGRSAMGIAMEKQLYPLADMIRAHQKAKILGSTSSRNRSNTNQQELLARAFDATKRDHVQDLKEIVPSYVNPDSQDYDLRTLLHVASAEGFLDIVKYLVDCGANVNLLDRWGNSPLSEAVDFAQNKVARFLINHHASESGHTGIYSSDHLDPVTLNTALEFALRTVARDQWVLGQVYCPIQEQHGSCVLVAHGVWHRNENANASAVNSPRHSFSTSTGGGGGGATAAMGDSIQMFRKIGSLMLIDPGQGHTGTVFSAQHPEWLNMNTILQSQFFMLPHARRAGIQTVVSVPMIYKLSAVAVLSWYSDVQRPEDPEEIQRIQRLLKSVTHVAMLRHEILQSHHTSNSKNHDILASAGFSSSTSSSSSMMIGNFSSLHMSRYQFCQALDSAITASGDFCSTSRPPSQDDLIVGDVFPLALEWNLFDYVDKLATSMSSEDHSAVISLLGSIVSLLKNGLFQDVLASNSSFDLQHLQLDTWIHTKYELLQRVKYALLYLQCVSPTEGNIFIESNQLLQNMNQYLSSKYIAANSANSQEEEDEPMPLASGARQETTVEFSSSSMSSSTNTNSRSADCILCKYKVPGHIHPGQPTASIPPQTAPVFHLASAEKSTDDTSDNFFDKPGHPKSPVLREIDGLLRKLIDEYDVFDAKAVLLERRWEAFKSSTFTSAEVYDSIGSSHVFPTTPRQAPSIASSRGAQKADFESQRQSLTEKLNEILQDDSCMITLEQFMMIHRCVLLETKGQSGVIRKSAAVGYASPRIYRVFLPYGEIETALQNLFDQVNCLENWQQRPLLCAYYTFAILVFYIHPFHDGNGRCARLVGNLIAKKMGYPGAFRALDKTIQLSEFLQKVLNTIDMLQNTRRARQARLISNRKENTSMWF